MGECVSQAKVSIQRQSPFPRKKCVYPLDPEVNLSEPLFLITRNLTKIPDLFNSSFKIYPTSVSSFIFGSNRLIEGLQGRVEGLEDNEI